MTPLKFAVFVVLLATTSFAQAETVISNLDQALSAAKPSHFSGSNGKAMDFKVTGDRPIELSEVVLRLKLSENSRPVLSVLEVNSAQPELVRLNQAGGLDGNIVRGDVTTLKPSIDAPSTEAVDVRFVPSEPMRLWPGATYRLGLSTETKQDEMLWLAGRLPRAEGSAEHIGQSYGNGHPTTWRSPSQVVNLYEIRGRWLDKATKRPQRPVEDLPEAEDYAQIAGIYPHLAMFNTERPIECGIGAVVNWADRLWAVTYAPYHHRGSTDKLFQIDDQYRMFVHPESVGGTPANRMIHEESKQLIIGPYFIDEKRKVRVIPPSVMPGRLTGNARHLTDPANKVYFATMEEGFYDVDVHTLAVKTISGDRRDDFAHGYHGKGLYSGQGRVVYSNNGNMGHKGHHVFGTLNQDHKAGSLNEWDGKRWKEVHRTGFLDVTGPGGIRGNKNPETDPIWSIGWDQRSVILKVLEKGTWHTYRMPKASHTMDGPHGYNTEWPRIGEIGSDTERLIYVHGMFWKMPTKFSTEQADGIRARSTYLKMVSDSTPWDGRIVFACNDLSNEPQAIWLNPRKIRGKLIPAIAHSNLWFVEPEQIDDFGVPMGRGSVWMYDKVATKQSSDAYQFGGWDKRLLHLSHQSEEAVPFTIELDKAGNGQWTKWKSVDVPAEGYLPVSLSDAPSAEWVRLTAEQDAEHVIAAFHYSNHDSRPTAASPIFHGIASFSDRDASGGLVRIKSTDGAPLAFATTDGSYYEMGSDMRLKPVDDPEAEADLRSIAEIIDPTEGGLTADEASVLYIDEHNNKRYRLPRGDAAFDQLSPLGFERVDREVCRERNLFNTHGTIYELPYRNAGDFALIRPVTTHNRRIKDFCTWRGLFVMTGIDQSAQENPRIIRSDDGKAGVWLGVVDELWKMGKAVGFGGPWENTPVKAGEPSDPYLMTGYDQKTLVLSHKSNDVVEVMVEVDVTGYGDWRAYQSFNVPAGERVSHRFPGDFNAYWVRAVSDTDTSATAQLRYE